MLLNKWIKTHKKQVENKLECVFTEDIYEKNNKQKMWTE